jgi:hypothetical protein
VTSPEGRVRVLNDPVELHGYLRKAGWTDGLPVVPPTTDLVSAMVAASGREAGEVVAVLPPLDGEASVERIAANAVLAGCDPVVAPILLAAVEAVADPDFNLLGVQATTHPCAVQMLVSGPAAGLGGIHGGEGCLGPGFSANLSLGRALRLVLMNIGGARPQTTDRSCQASPAKVAYCFTENVEDSPWPAFHVAEGWSQRDSTVTVSAAEGPHNIQDHTSKTAAGILDTIAGSMRNVGCNDLTLTLGRARGRPASMWRPRPLVVFGPEHAHTVAREGLSRTDVQQALWSSARVSPSEVPREWREGLAPDRRIPLTERSGDLIILVAGGYGKHSCWMPTFGLSSAVTRKIHI